MVPSKPHLNKNAPIDKAGFVDKKGTLSWTRRWFILQGPFLFWYEQKQSPPLFIEHERGSADLTQGFSIVLEPSSSHPNTFKLFNSKHTYTISLPTKEEINEWIDRFNTAIKFSENNVNTYNNNNNINNNNNNNINTTLATPPLTTTPTSILPLQQIQPINESNNMPTNFSDQNTAVYSELYGYSLYSKQELTSFPASQTTLANTNTNILQTSASLTPQTNINPNNSSNPIVSLPPKTETTIVSTQTQQNLILSPPSPLTTPVYQSQTNTPQLQYPIQQPVNQYPQNYSTTQPQQTQYPLQYQPPTIYDPQNIYSQQPKQQQSTPNYFLQPQPQPQYYSSSQTQNIAPYPTQTYTHNTYYQQIPPNYSPITQSQNLYPQQPYSQPHSPQLQPQYYPPPNQSQSVTPSYPPQTYPGNYYQPPLQTQAPYYQLQQYPTQTYYPQ